MTQQINRNDFVKLYTLINTHASWQRLGCAIAAGLGRGRVDMYTDRWEWNVRQAQYDILFCACLFCLGYAVSSETEQDCMNCKLEYK